MEQEPVIYSPHGVVVERVKELRKRRGWSAQKLAEEMAGVGVPWERMVVTKLENGRRASLTVEELLALAYVLDVAPLHLLVPPVDDGDKAGPFYKIVPSLGFPIRDVRAWIRGRDEAPGQDPRLYFSEVPTDDTDPAPKTSADIAAESARIQYHRRNGHLMRDGLISSEQYFREASEAEAAARRQAGS